MTRQHKTGLLALLAGAAAVTAGPAWAQADPAPPASPTTQTDANPEPEEAEADATVEEIVVTARRREESLQDTPIAITALSASDLQDRNITSIAEIGRVVPNLQFDTTSTSSGSSAISVLFLRGVGQSDFLLTVEPGVATYVDGVYVARSVGAVFDVLDLERVEVLRGPQGTLFGKNTIGGALSLTSRRPSFDGFGGSVEATLGSDNRADLRADVNVPINDKLAIKLAASTRNQDGYVERVLTDLPALGDINRDAARAAVRYRPTETLEFNLALDATRVREEGAPSAGSDYNCEPGVPTLCAAYNRLRANPADPRSFVNDQYVSTNPDVSFQTGPTASDLDVFGAAFTADWDLGGVELKSITAYRDLDAFFQRDSDNTPVPLAFTFNNYSSRQFSQEFQILGQAFDDRLKYVAGVYYLAEEGEDFSSSNLTLLAATNTARIDNRSYAVFGQGTFALTDRLSTTAGLRFTRETKELFLEVLRPNLTAIVPAGTSEQEFENTSPRIGVEYKAAPDILLYASYSQGFKSGGFNIRYLQAPAPRPTAFEPEELTAYEVGIKSQFLDDRLRINAAAFYSDYTNLQVLIRNAIATQITNAGEATIKGLELETVAVLARGITLTGGFGYTDAEYERVPPIVPPATVNDQIELSDEFAKTPKYTANIALELRRPSGWTGIELVSVLDYSFRSKVYNDAVNAEIASQGAYSLVNASIGFESDRGWRIVGFIKNLFDERYLINAQSGLASVGFAEVNYARGAEGGVTLGYRF